MTIYSLVVFLSSFEPAHCSMSGSNCCFLICIHVSQEAGKVVLYSHLFKNFPQFVVIHPVKGFSEVNEAEVKVFLEFSCFSFWSNGCWQFDLWFLCFFKIQLVHLKFLVHILLKPSLKGFEHYFASMSNECKIIVWYLYL